MTNIIWSRYGEAVYQVGDEVFTSKAQALEYSTRTRQPVSFHFFDDIWEKLDWATEPDVSLDDIYMARAAQLRDKYDYLILTFSAGSDTTQMVKSFLKAGIKPDEVVTYGVLNKIIDKEHTCNIELTRAGASTIKLLEEANIPWRFINCWDHIDNLVALDERSFYHVCDTRLAPDNFLVGTAWNVDPTIMKQVETGKRVGLVFGKEKPRLNVIDGYFTNTFLDMNMNSGNYHDGVHHNLHYERFYSTPDMPELVVKQLHVLIKHFRKNVPEFEKKLTHTKEFDQQGYYNEIQDVIYPDWKRKDYFSLGKSPSMMWDQKYRFVYEQLDWKPLQTYWYYLRNLRASLDTKFIQQDGDMPLNKSFKMPGFYSPFYRICKV